jgi:hypothetical protein
VTEEKRELPGWIMPAGLALLVAILVTVALTRGPATFDPDTPEGAVQEYLVAMSEGRWDDAVEVIHEDWRRSCTGSDLESFAPGNFSAELGSGGGRFGGIVEERFTSVDPGVSPTMPDETTMVEVTIQRGGPGGWNEHTTFELGRTDGFWWLIGDPWPYFVWSCEERP